MTTLNAEIIKGIPCCPECGNHTPGRSDYGCNDEGFWFSYICEQCSTSGYKVVVKYYTNQNFKVIEESINASNNRN